MSVYKFFDAPKFHDSEFYKDREVSDHINEPGHRERLLKTLSDIGFVLDIDPASTSVTDLGCGSGGLLHEIAQRHPQRKAWGYDLSPKAVEYAVRNYGVSARLLDFVNEPIECGDVVVLTEVLEHLVDPPALLEKLRTRCRWLVVSCPAMEDANRHYEFHLWAWTPESFREMFKRLGYGVLCHYAIPCLGTQFLIARAH